MRGKRCRMLNGADITTVPNYLISYCIVFRLLLINIFYWQLIKINTYENKSLATNEIG